MSICNNKTQESRKNFCVKLLSYNFWTEINIMACHRQWTIICTENYEPGIHERKEEKSMKNTLNKI